MKNFINKGMFLFIFLGLFIFIGCSSTPITYMMTNDEINSATISFKSGSPSVTFLEYNGIELPVAEKNTRWDPLAFPSGVPLNISVRAYYYKSSYGYFGSGLFAVVTAAASAAITATRNVDTIVVFNCPPLEAGKNYTLTFRKEAGVPGRNILILKDNSARGEVYRQDFEMN
ncbi:MAG: hypothetical protein FWB73_06650 [Treponema sp.]|nr:hypothetical protein [Treponema sp.]